MIVVAGVIAAFVVMWLMRSRRSRMCRWRENRAAQEGQTRRWQCVACGATAKTDGPRQPDWCALRQP